MRLLFAPAHERNVEARRDAMFAAKGSTRPSIAPCCMSPCASRQSARGNTLSTVVDVVPAVHRRAGTHARVQRAGVRAASGADASGSKITDVVNIGIGGLISGLQMVSEVNLIATFIRGSRCTS